MPDRLVPGMSWAQASARRLDRHALSAPLTDAEPSVSNGKLVHFRHSESDPATSHDAGATPTIVPPARPDVRAQPGVIRQAVFASPRDVLAHRRAGFAIFPGRAHRCDQA
jgi:hypothetical protein